MSLPVARSPEAYFTGLNRKDSKHALKTCFGLTTSGKPCRRSLSAAVQRLNEASTWQYDPTVDDDDDLASTLAIVNVETANGFAPVAFYCWQHKDQAQALDDTAQQRNVLEVRTRSELDKAISAMRLEDRTVANGPALRRTAGSSQPAAAAKARPSQQRELTTVAHRREEPPIPVEVRATKASQSYTVKRKPVGAQHRTSAQRQDQTKTPSCWTTLFHRAQGSSTRAGHRKRQRAVSSANETRDGRHRSSHQNRAIPQKVQHHTKQRGTVPADARISVLTDLEVEMQALEIDNAHATHSERAVPHGPRATPVYTQSLLSTDESSVSEVPQARSRSQVPHTCFGALATAGSPIPPDASFALAAALLWEMRKIAQDNDEGYIYVYQMAGSSTTNHDTTARSLPSSPLAEREASVQPGVGEEKYLLKIGRSENVRRRQSQWNAQCGQNPELVSVWPRPEQAIKARHLRCVENLVHIELRALNVAIDCKACGKTHKEWFQVDGRRGFRAVEMVIGKWVEWANKQP